MTEKKLKIAMGCDHAGYECKEEVKKILEHNGYDVKDFGTHSVTSVDYPDFVHPVAQTIENKERDYGILICGSGNGVAMTANKYQHVRAALCWKKEIAALARQHNDANIICMPSRYADAEEIKNMVNTFLNTPFEGGRHQNRVNKINKQ